MKKYACISVILAILMIFASCSKEPVTETTSETSSTTKINEDVISSDAAETSSFAETSSLEETQSNSEENTQNNGGNDSSDAMFSSRDSEIDIPENAVKIVLSGDSASSSSDAVKISGGVITLSEEADYVISGTLNDGMIFVNADDTAKIRLIFDGADITNTDGAALYILSCDKVFVTLAENSENKLSNGGTFTAIDDNNIDGTVFSKQDLTFNGNGSLTVDSPVAHAVVCKDDLVFTSGNYTLNSASHGLDVNDSVRVKNATVNISAGKDGIHCENEDNTELGFIYLESGTFDITAEGDGISAGTYLTVLGGNYNILAGGGSENAEKTQSDNWGGFMGGMGGKGDMGGKGGMGGNRPDASQGGTQQTSVDNSVSTESDSDSIKGIKASGNITVSGGTFTVDSADDAIHSNSNVYINGGTFTLKTGDDGMHADESLSVTAGDIEITESYEGLEALDISFSGGNVKLVSSDDGFNAAGGTDSSGTGGRDGGMFGGMPGMSSGNGSIVISGGSVYINASGDGIDANGTLEITGGHTVVVGPTQGDTATLDYDKTAVISGGTFIGTGAAGMAQTFSDSTQGVVAVSVGTQAAGTKITLADKSGKVLIDFTPELSFGVVILSSPDIEKGEEYDITVGDAEGSFEAS